MAKDAQWMVAQDTFAGDLESGAAFTVLKGQHFLSTNEVVKLDGGRGVLFKPLDVGDEEPPSKSEPAKAETPPPVKSAPAAKRPAGKTGS